MPHINSVNVSMVSIISLLKIRKSYKSLTVCTSVTDIEQKREHSDINPCCQHTPSNMKNIWRLNTLSMSATLQ